MERFGVLLSSPSPASPSSTPSRSPSPSPSCVKGQASIFCIYRITSHFITYRADTYYFINITYSALPIPHDSFHLHSSQVFIPCRYLVLFDNTYSALPFPHDSFTSTTFFHYTFTLPDLASIYRLCTIYYNHFLFHRKYLSSAGFQTYLSFLL